MEIKAVESEAVESEAMEIKAVVSEAVVLEAVEEDQVDLEEFLVDKLADSEIPKVLASELLATATVNLNTVCLLEKVCLRNELII